jgi:peptide/nickel transport system substrate-binding protein
MNKKPYLIVVGLLLLGLLLVACGSETSDEPTEAPSVQEPAEEPAVQPTEEPMEEATEAPAEEPTEEPMEEPMEEPLIIGTTDSWSSFEPAWVYSFHDWELFHQCADGLLNAVPGTAGEVEPALAESYEVSDDGLEYTFHLREGVVFPDGTPFNADAVMFTLDRIGPIDEMEGANAGFLYTGYAEGAEKIDDMTVKVTFQGPYAFAPQLVATNVWKIVNPNIYSADEAGTELQACGIGPYVLESFVEGEEAVFVANESYYGTPPAEHKVIVRYFAESPTMALALQNGEIDIAWKSLAPADFGSLTGADGIVTETAGGTEIRYITYNSTTPPFDNPNVRLALAMMVNREELGDLAWQGIKVPLYSMVPPGFLGHKPTYEGTEDMAAAIAMLAEAGFDADNPLVMDLWYSPTHYGDTEPDVAAVLKQQLEASGVVEVSLQFLEWAAYRDAGRAGELPFQLLGWYPDYLDPDNYTNVFAHSPAAWSGSYYDNPVMDEMLDAQAVEQDLDARAQLLEDIQDLWVTESPFVPLGQGKLVIGYRDNISGVVIDPLALFHYFLVEKG